GPGPDFEGPGRCARRHMLPEVAVHVPTRAGNTSGRTDENRVGSRYDIPAREGKRAVDGGACAGGDACAVVDGEIVHAGGKAAPGHLGGGSVINVVGPRAERADAADLDVSRGAG